MERRVTGFPARAIDYGSSDAGIAHRPMPTPYSGPQVSVGHGRCSSPSRSRQNDEARVVGSTMDEARLFSVARQEPAFVAAS